MFHVGQKVACVLQPQHPWYLNKCPNRPVKDGVYTIREIMFVEGVMGFLLGELLNPARPWSNAPFSEPGFHHGFFRPVDERKTDISIFTKMLTGSPQKVEA